MPIFFRASVFQPVARTRNSAVSRGSAPQVGPTPNGNSLILLSSALRTSAVLRNINNIFNPAATEVLWYGYTDDVDLTLTGFPLEPGASIAIEANRNVYAKSGSVTAVEWVVDGGEE